jgi:hypothetical protein
MNIIILFNLIACGFVVVVIYLVLTRLNKMGGIKGIQELAKQRQLEAQMDHPVKNYPQVAETARSSYLYLVVGVIALSGLGFIAVGLIWGAIEANTMSLLQNDSQLALATVIGKTMETDSDDDVVYYLTYTFSSDLQDASLQKLTRREAVSPETYEAFNRGDTIEIIFVRSDPTISRIASEYHPGIMDLGPGLLFVPMGIGDLLFGLFFYRRLCKAQRLDEDGILASARVLDRYEDSSGDSTTYYVALQLPTGQPFRMFVDGKIYNQAPAGSFLNVRYLSDDPTVFRLEKIT